MPSVAVEPKAMGTRKFARPQPGMDQRKSAKPVSRCACETRSRNGSSCASVSEMTSATTSGNRQSIFARGDSPWMNCCSHKTETMSQVNRIISGPPASICTAPTMAARKISFPPSRHARSASSTTHGIQLNVAMWLGHMMRFSVKPLKAKAIPANAAAKLIPACVAVASAQRRIQRRARKYIPNPAHHKCSSENIPSDHFNGSAR